MAISSEREDDIVIAVSARYLGSCPPRPPRFESVPCGLAVPSAYDSANELPNSGVRQFVTWPPCACIAIFTHISISAPLADHVYKASGFPETTNQPRRDEGLRVFPGMEARANGEYSANHVGLKVRSKRASRGAPPSKPIEWQSLAPGPSCESASIESFLRARSRPSRVLSPPSLQHSFWSRSLQEMA